MSELRRLIRRQPRARIVDEQALYLHAEFRSPWLSFVDDVEFVINPRTRQVHFRSASRSGYSDLGVNRRRMEELSQALSDVPGIEVQEE